MKKTRFSDYGIFMVGVFLFVPEEAFAYLDPGTGSYVIQVIIALILGVIYSLKLYWTKIKEFALKIFRVKRNNEEK